MSKISLSTIIIIIMLFSTLVFILVNGKPCNNLNHWLFLPDSLMSAIKLNLVHFDLLFFKCRDRAEKSKIIKRWTNALVLFFSAVFKYRITEALSCEYNCSCAATENCRLLNIHCIYENGFSPAHISQEWEKNRKARMKFGLTAA